MNNIRKLVILAQLVEQWTGNPEVVGSSTLSNHLTFGCLQNSYRFPLLARCMQKLKNK